MDYERWIRRERRIRGRILRDSRMVRERGMCRICGDCEEICLCHEEWCPNCGSENLGQGRVENVAAELAEGARISCKRRFDHLG